MDKTYRILVINPGSTSTKVGYYENEECKFETSVFHDAPILLKFSKATDQFDYRREVILDELRKQGIELEGMDAWVGRGGSLMPLAGGTYEINDRMIEDTRNMVGGQDHPANLGVLLAKSFQEMYGGRMFMVDSPNTDEFDDVARITGLKGVYRGSHLHALNLKGTARKHAAAIGKKYEDCNLIVCHLDGGISISAHKKGRMIDGNDNAGGMGPFTPTRIGTLPASEAFNYAEGKDIKEVRKILTRAGGFVSHFGTSNKDAVHEMVESGDEYATLVWEAMGYQTAKSIGEMAAVLEGEIDGIVLGGGLVKFKDFTDQIERRCGWMAPITIYYDEFEHQSMCNGALRVLLGEEEPLQYTGMPVFDGTFDFEK